SPAGIGAGICGDEAEVLDAALELAEHVRRIGRVAELRQLCGAREAIGEVLALSVDAVVDEACPGWCEVLFHEAHHSKRSWSDDLDGGVACIRIIRMALLRAVQHFRGLPRRAWSTRTLPIPGRGHG